MALQYAYIYIIGQKYKALMINETLDGFSFICPITKSIIHRRRDRNIDFVSFSNDKGCVNLYKCKHCSGDKKTETGLCSHCGKFPTDGGIENKKDVEEKISKSFKNFTNK